MLKMEHSIYPKKCIHILYISVHRHKKTHHYNITNTFLTPLRIYNLTSHKNQFIFRFSQNLNLRCSFIVFYCLHFSVMTLDLMGKMALVIMLKTICSHLTKLTTNSCAHYVFRTNLVIVVYHLRPLTTSVLFKLYQMVFKHRR